MNRKVSWGILGAASIAVKKVIPAMQAAGNCDVRAIASRDATKAKSIAEGSGIPRFYGSYDELIRDPEIDAVYIPLPNHLHLEWTTKAANAGKHVLCEKPIGMNADEVRRMIEVRDRTGVRIQEGFMVRTHPLWIAVRELVQSRRIGNANAITMFFSYANLDRTNIRNRIEMGGGGLMDIGCYCINLSRFVFDDEPGRVSALIERDSETGIDSLTSAMLDFSGRHATFTCATQITPFQRMQIIGTNGRIEVEIPVNIPTDSPTRIFIDDGADLYGRNVETIHVETADQFAIQWDLFSRSILERSAEGLSLEDSFCNMAAIDAVFRSARTGNWETPESL